MGAFKNEKNGTWYVQFRYTDWQGLRQQKLKRGFATKREAQEWERAFLTEKKADVTMPFKTFTELYEKDVRPKLKENTWLTKEHIIKTKILPYFEHKRLCDISAKDVIAWQNEIRKMTNSSGEPLSQGYLKTIYQTAEDGLSDTIKPRLLAGNAECSQIKVIDESEAALSMLDSRVEQAIIETGAKAIILDPMQAYIGAKTDINKANEVRSVLSQLGRIAEDYGCAVILVGHLNKSRGSKANYRGLGSIDFEAAARSVLLVGRLKDDENIRVVAHEKSSLAPNGKPIAFELSEENGFVWKGHYEISIDDLANGISREKKSEQAENLIRDCLSNGKYPQQIILKKAQNTGISKRVLDEAKKSLGIISIKDGCQWYWKLPEEKEARNF